MVSSYLEVRDRDSHRLDSELCLQVAGDFSMAFFLEFGFYSNFESAAGWFVGSGLVAGLGLYFGGSVD